MTFQLTDVAFSKDWSKFLNFLPGWSEKRAGQMVGSGAEISLHSDSGRISVCVVSGSTRRGYRAFKITPDSLKEIDVPDIDLKRKYCSSKAVLNHLAIDVPLDDDDTIKLFENSMTVFLPKKERYDPAVKKSICAEHLIGPDGDYLTLRYVPEAATPRLSHVGFQFESLADLMNHKQILNKAGWPIVVGPEVIDGSMVIHFKGPDGLIHDLFHVLDDLDT